MEKILLIITFFISSVAMSQTNGKIEMKKDFLGYTFHQDSTDLLPKDVLQVMEVNKEAFQEFKKARANHAAAGIFSAIGGFAIGWPIGQAIAGKDDPLWGLAAGGAVLVVMGYSFDKTFKRRSIKAIDIYNGGLTTSSAVKLNLRLTGTGIQMNLKF
jgi:hypothetical protein